MVGRVGGCQSRTVFFFFFIPLHHRRVVSRSVGCHRVACSSAAPVATPVLLLSVEFVRVGVCHQATSGYLFLQQGGKRQGLAVVGASGESEEAVSESGRCGLASAAIWRPPQRGVLGREKELLDNPAIIVPDLARMPIASDSCSARLVCFAATVNSTAISPSRNTGAKLFPQRLLEKSQWGGSREKCLVWSWHSTSTSSTTPTDSYKDAVRCSVTQTLSSRRRTCLWSSSQKPWSNTLKDPPRRFQDLPNRYRERRAKGLLRLH